MQFGLTSQQGQSIKVSLLPSPWGQFSLHSLCIILYTQKKKTSGLTKLFKLISVLTLIGF